MAVARVAAELPEELLLLPPLQEAKRCRRAGNDHIKGNDSNKRRAMRRRKGNTKLSSWRRIMMGTRRWERMRTVRNDSNNGSNDNGEKRMMRIVVREMVGVGKRRMRRGRRYRGSC